MLKSHGNLALYNYYLKNYKNLVLYNYYLKIIKILNYINNNLSLKDKTITFKKFYKFLIYI